MHPIPSRSPAISPPFLFRSPQGHYKLVSIWIPFRSYFVCTDDGRIICRSYFVSTLFLHGLHTFGWPFASQFWYRATSLHSASSCPKAPIWFPHGSHLVPTSFAQILALSKCVPTWFLLGSYLVCTPLVARWCPIHTPTSAHPPSSLDIKLRQHCSNLVPTSFPFGSYLVPTSFLLTPYLTPTRRPQVVHKSFTGCLQPNLIDFYIRFTARLHL